MVTDSDNCFRWTPLLLQHDQVPACSTATIHPQIPDRQRWPTGPTSAIAASWPIPFWCTKRTWIPERGRGGIREAFVLVGCRRIWSAICRPARPCFPKQYLSLRRTASRPRLGRRAELPRRAQRVVTVVSASPAGALLSAGLARSAYSDAELQALRESNGRRVKPFAQFAPGRRSRSGAPGQLARGKTTRILVSSVAR